MIQKMKKYFMCSVACLLVTCSVAQAELFALGPIDPNTGFPAWYKDPNGLALELGTDIGFNHFDPVDPCNPFSVQIGFGDEAFYWLAEATIDMAGGNDALLVLALELAFDAGPPVDGDQLVFARVRIRIDTPVAGTYTVTHPYGVQLFPNALAGIRAINLSSDIGAATPAFDAALNGAIGPFLVALAPGPPAGFVGNPNLDQTVTGSPFGTNYFRIDGPPGSNLDGAGNDFVQTNLFSVQGQISGATGSGCTGPILSDLNNDCQVTLLDFMILSDEWMLCNLTPPEDCL